MPGGSGTGPMGRGPKTGRAAGYCAGFGAPGYAGTSPGRGFGMGYGRGRGFGRDGWGRRNRAFVTDRPVRMQYGGTAVPYEYPAPPTAPGPETEMQALRNQADALKSEMDYINKRLSELEAGSAKE